MKKIFWKTVEALMSTSIVAMSLPFIAIFVLGLLEDGLGINTGLVNEQLGKILITMFLTGISVALPSLAATIKHWDREDARDIRKKGESLAKAYSVEQLLKLYAEARERIDLLEERQRNLHDLRRAAKHAYDANRNTAIIFETKTLRVVDQKGVGFTSDTADVITDTLMDQAQLSAIPAASLALDDTSFDAIYCDIMDGIRKSWQESKYLEYALAIKSTNASITSEVFETGVSNADTICVDNTPHAHEIQQNTPEASEPLMQLPS